MPKGSPGKKKSPEHIEKLRDAAKRRYASDAAKRQQSERMKDVFRDNPSCRRMHTTESRRRQAQTMEDLWADADYRAKMIAVRNDPEYLLRIRERMSTLWNDSDYRQTMSEAMRDAKRRSYVSPERLENRDWLIEQNQTKTLTQMAEDMGCSQSFMSGVFHRHNIVPVSHVVQYTGGEDAIVAYLQQLGVTNIQRRVRHIIAPYEIDIYLPDHKVGIEYHGVYWHSYTTHETTQQRQRHSVKAKLAQESGIRLLQFWDTEWSEMPQICQSIISSAVGKNKKLYARDCHLAVPPRDACKSFLVEHHLQGYCPYQYAYGLYDQQELVMVMTIGKSRFAKGHWELLRMVTRRGWTVVGGAERLWKRIVEVLPSGTVIDSYADQRLFTGQVYARLGFTYHHTTPPGYQYVLDGRLYSRLQFQKHKLSKLFANYTDAVTEADNMFANGYRRLWDAGQAVWCGTIS